MDWISGLVSRFETHLWNIGIYWYILGLYNDGKGLLAFFGHFRATKSPIPEVYHVIMSRCSDKNNKNQQEPTRTNRTNTNNSNNKKKEEQKNKNNQDKAKPVPMRNVRSESKRNTCVRNCCLWAVRGKNNGPNMLPIASKEILKINHAIGICSGGLRSSSGARALRRPAGHGKKPLGVGVMIGRLLLIFLKGFTNIVVNALYWYYVIRN